MLVSYVVRLATEALIDGRLAGEVHVVSTGQRTTVRSGDELIAVLVAAALDPGVRAEE